MGDCADASTDPEAQALQTELAAIVRRDEQAMKRFYQALAPSVYQFSMRRLSDPVQAQEVVVETLYEVWRHAASFAEQSSVRTWVLGIARYKLLDKLRERYRHKHLSFDEQLDSHADDNYSEPECDAPTGFERVVQREQHDMIAHCAGKLPPDQREALHLALYEDMLLSDIAQVQACPQNTVKTRLFHARRKMKECLQRLFKDAEGPMTGVRHD